MTVKEITMKNYPKYWNKARVAYLVKIGRLTAEDYKEVTGESYKAESEIDE